MNNLKFEGVTVNDVNFNGVPVNVINFNGVKVWERNAPTNALCFTALEANSTVSLTRNGTPESINLEYSVDGTNWNTFEIGTFYTLPTVNSQIYIRNTSSSTTGFIYSSGNYYRFTCSGKLKISGDITTLINKSGNVLDLSVKNNYFNGLFAANISLIDASDLILPSTILSYTCYAGMFSGCSRLVTVPELPATTLADGCYASMFSSCASLTYAPELPATTLAEGCYSGMFQQCTSLVSAPELPATTLPNGCYYRMFSNCTNLNYIKCLLMQTHGGFLNSMGSWVYDVSPSGTFIKYAGVDIPLNSENGIPTGWTVEEIGTLISHTLTDVSYLSNVSYDTTQTVIYYTYDLIYDTGVHTSITYNQTITYPINQTHEQVTISGSITTEFEDTISYTIIQGAKPEITLNWGVDADLEYSPDVLTRTGFIEFTDNANLSYITGSGSSGTLNNPHFVRPGDSRGYYGDGIDGYINLLNYVTSSSFSYRNDINFRTDAGVAEEDRVQHILDLLTTWKNQGAKIVQAWYKDAVWERYKKVTFGGPFNNDNITVLGIIVCSGHIISQERYNLFWWTVTPSTTTADGRPGFKTTSSDGEGYNSTGLAMAVIYKEN